MKRFCALEIERPESGINPEGPSTSIDAAERSYSAQAALCCMARAAALAERRLGQRNGPSARGHAEAGGGCVPGAQNHRQTMQRIALVSKTPMGVNRVKSAIVFSLVISTARTNARPY